MMMELGDERKAGGGREELFLSLGSSDTDEKYAQKHTFLHTFYTLEMK
jgi:hypothetical protein